MEGLDLCITLCDTQYMADMPLNLFLGEIMGKNQRLFCSSTSLELAVRIPFRLGSAD